MGKRNNIEKNEVEEGGELENTGIREPRKSIIVLRLRKEKNSEDYKKSKDKNLCHSLLFD